MGSSMQETDRFLSSCSEGSACLQAAITIVMAVKMWLPSRMPNPTSHRHHRKGEDVQRKTAFDVCCTRDVCCSLVSEHAFQSSDFFAASQLCSSFIWKDQSCKALTLYFWRNWGDSEQNHKFQTGWPKLHSSNAPKNIYIYPCKTLIKLACLLWAVEA